MQSFPWYAVRRGIAGLLQLSLHPPIVSDFSSRQRLQEHASAARDDDASLLDTFRNAPLINKL